MLLRITFEINQPVTWELHLAGDSNIELPIEWSIDAESANTDEPTSLTEPRSITLVGATTFGGLMDSDVDCFRFDVDEHLSALTVTISWDATPLEVEQAHIVPQFWDENGDSEDTPEIRTRYEGDIVVNEFRWAEPNSGEHTLCWTGEDDHFQTYSFIGSQSMLGVGSTTPAEFTGKIQSDRRCWCVHDGGCSHRNLCCNCWLPHAIVITMVATILATTLNYSAIVWRNHLPSRIDFKRVAESR